MGPQSAHAREVVLELRQLDLELSLCAVRVVGEDVEDHRGAIDHRHAERRLEVPLLARHELVVAGDQVGVAADDFRLQLGQLAAPQVAVGVRAGADLDKIAGGRDAGGAQELLELGKGFIVGRRSGQGPDRERALASTGILDACSAGPVLGFRNAALAGSVHSSKCRPPSRRPQARLARGCPDPDRLRRG